MKNSISFEEAYDAVMKHEGGYANNPDDTGGETYCGISRRFHPEWPGWKYIDNVKENWIKKIKSNTKFKGLSKDVKAFYKINYWDKINCDLINDVKLVTYMFDAAVNCGTIAAGKFLQRTLNVLNNRQRSWKDIKVDGFIGAQTIRMLRTAYLGGKASLIHTAFTIMRGAYYIDIMERRESQEQFAVAWLSRLWIKIT